MAGLRDRLLGMDTGRTRSPGAISQFEAFRHGPEGPLNPFAGLQQATAPMATAGMNSLNGAPTTTAPTGGGGGGAGATSALSTGAPIGTMAHDGGGGPFTFGFPFGVEDSGGWEPSDMPEDIGEAGGAGEDSGDTGDTGGGGDDDGGDGDEG